ncbi:hypothetical protein M5X00_22170 [Paenibacillus alvei]|uniref:hypothetical protein n=1 Tax=Paenibacillus alvei TaxID=44250 RepID=UPI00227F9493|nr:hypothetical protein [Paenibacillus alvei]MCY9756953.1 hypothetical protein [Paenibacillus alvei]
MASVIEWSFRWLGLRLLLLVWALLGVWTLIRSKEERKNIEAAALSECNCYASARCHRFNFSPLTNLSLVSPLLSNMLQGGRAEIDPFTVLRR